MCRIANLSFMRQGYLWQQQCPNSAKSCAIFNTHQQTRALIVKCAFHESVTTIQTDTAGQSDPFKLL